MRQVVLIAVFILLSGCAAAQAECVTGGCSGQLCMEASPTGDGMMTTCEWKAEYGCYQRHGACERQPDGVCGWTPSDELLSCLKQEKDPAR